jgi:hypothetical protein
VVDAATGTAWHLFRRSVLAPVFVFGGLIKAKTNAGKKKAATAQAAAAACGCSMALRLFFATVGVMLVAARHQSSVPMFPDIFAA